MTGSPDDYIFGANGIPRRGMSSPWWSPLHLLRQSWGPNRLLLMAVRQSRWILKQFCSIDLKVKADKFDILRTLPEYLEELTSNTSQAQIWLILNKMIKLKKWTWALLTKLQVYASLSGCLTRNYFLFNLTLSSAWSTNCIQKPVYTCCVFICLIFIWIPTYVE